VKDPKNRIVMSACRAVSDVCENLGTDQHELINLYLKARALPDQEVFVA